MLSFKRTKSDDLLKSQLFNETTFYRFFFKDLKNAKTNVIIESPYLTERRAIQFSETLNSLKKRGIKIRVYTRLPSHHNKTLEIQAWKAVSVLRKSGVKVNLCSDLRHRKIAVIDDRIMWDGSLNILSQNRSCEIMRRTESAELSKQLLKFIGLRGRIW